MKMLVSIISKIPLTYARLKLCHFFKFIEYVVSKVDDIVNWARKGMYMTLSHLKLLIL